MVQFPEPGREAVPAALVTMQLTMVIPLAPAVNVMLSVLVAELIVHW